MPFGHSGPAAPGVTPPRAAELHVIFSKFIASNGTMKTILILALVGVASIGLGCTQQAPQNAIAPQAAQKSVDQNIDQANLCEVKVWQHDDVAAVCKAGQKVVFLPASFGNEQLPIIFAAVNCDLRYQVALTRGAVTCIYQPITPVQPRSEPAASSASR